MIRAKTEQFFLQSSSAQQRNDAVLKRVTGLSVMNLFRHNTEGIKEINMERKHIFPDPSL